MKDREQQREDPLLVVTPRVLVWKVALPGEPGMPFESRDAEDSSGLSRGLLAPFITGLRRQTGAGEHIRNRLFVVSPVFSVSCCH